MQYKLERCLAGLLLPLLLPLGARAVTVQLQPVSGSDSNNRWMNIADNLYSSAYQGSFAYIEPVVTVSYSSVAGSFSGTLTATGLKPDFAYQMKLVGNPDMDNWSSEQLGYAGRWWRVQPDPGNSSDTDYDNHKDDPGYVYQGYLLFDFFATDSQAWSLSLGLRPGHGKFLCGQQLSRTLGYQ